MSSAMPRKARPCLATENREAARPPCATPSPDNAACPLYAIPGPDDGRSLSYLSLAKQHVRQWLHLNQMKLRVNHTYYQGQLTVCQLSLLLRQVLARASPDCSRRCVQVRCALGAVLAELDRSVANRASE